MLTFPQPAQERPTVSFEVAGREHGDVHLARSLALASVLDHWADVTFSTPIPPYLEAAYPGLGHGAESPPDALVIDTPDTERRKALVSRAREAGQRSVLVTDRVTDLRSDVLICATTPGSGVLGRGGSADLSLLGPSFAMVDPAFHPRDAAPTTARRAVVSLGAPSTPALLRPILSGLRALNLDIDVLLPTGVDLPRFPQGIDVYVAQAAESTARLLRGADVAIVTAGQPSLEALATATPMAVIATNPEQLVMAQAYERLGVGRSLGSSKDLRELDVRDAACLLTDSATAAGRYRRAVELDPTSGCDRISVALSGVLRAVATT
jgi:spore coat polysaccharide biosynthesis predicted glycosyltransferase SpsG